MVTQTNSEYVKFQNLEERCLAFAKAINRLVMKLPRTIPNQEVAKQLVRSAGSIGANYIEANDCLSHKDFLFRIKISKKEAKETAYWLEILEVSKELIEEKVGLINEARQLVLIFAAIYRKSALIAPNSLTTKAFRL